MAAVDRGHSGAWFFISVFLSPIFAVLLLIAYHVKRDSQYLPLSILNVKTDLERKKEQPLRFCEKEFEGQEGE
jgi:hypothetical protein